MKVSVRSLDSLHQLWALFIDGNGCCTAANMSYLEAIDVFAANHPELMVDLDDLKAEDLCGVPEKPVRQRTNGNGRQRKTGSGARFRELILAGKSNAECLEIVRREFPDSKATLSDAAWQRAALRKNPLGYAPNGRKV